MAIRINRKSWKDFRDSGMSWLVNRTLHLFGWSLMYSTDRKTGEILEVFPARVNLRGFKEEFETEGFIKISEYMKENAEDLLSEAKEIAYRNLNFK